MPFDHPPGVLQAANASNGSVRVAALGDLMLSEIWDSGTAIRPGLAGLRDALEADLVFANLETSVEAGDGRIPKEPRVLATTETICTALDALSVGVVNLANNHAFDGNTGGFVAVRELLERRGITHFGAGLSLDEASESRIVEVGGVRLGFLGYVSAATGVSHAAANSAPGVNVLAEERARADVTALRARVDHVLVSLHWGVEYCDLPSPEQIVFARSLVDCGARVIIGHHAHVIQGLERYRDGLIAYGIGNATTTDHYIDGRRSVRQSSRTRSSVALRVNLSRRSLESFETIPLLCAGTRVEVNSPAAGRYLERANRRLARGVSPSRWRRRRLWEDVVARTARKLHPAVVSSLRPAHLSKFFRNILRAVKGVGPAP